MHPAIYITAILIAVCVLILVIDERDRREIEKYRAERAKRLEK